VLIHEAIHPPSSYRAHSLWRSLADYSIGPDDATLTFVDRLARENGWSANHTARVIEEYRRFVFIAIICDHSVTPSDAVDQAWHLHLTYTRDYWERFCPMLGKPLHHGPTAGGRDEEQRYFRQYADTLASYERVFGEIPPADLLPDAAQRLRDDPRARRVHPRDGLWLRWRVVVALGAAWAALAIVLALT
jgi:hypothetical protein